MSVVEKKDTPLDVVLGLLALPILIVVYTFKILYTLFVKFPTETNRFIGMLRTGIMIGLIDFEVGLFFFQPHKDAFMHLFNNIGFSESFAGVLSAIFFLFVFINLVAQFVFVAVLGINTTASYSSQEEIIRTINDPHPGMTQFMNALDGRLLGRSWSGMKDVFRDTFRN